MYMSYHYISITKLSLYAHLLVSLRQPLETTSAVISLTPD